MNAKILILKEKKVFVEELGKALTVVKPVQYFVTDLTRDFHTKHGVISKADLGAKPGSIVKSSKGKEFVIITAGFVDILKRIKRLPQTIPLKDMGLILAETGVNKDSVVVDGGTGSGALACFLGHNCKKVTSYDTKEECVELAKQNIKMLGLKNVVVKKGDITKPIPEKGVDLFTLDIPEPQAAIKTAESVLKIGGWLVAYTIQASQLQDFVNALKQNSAFQFVKSCELLERLWKVEGKILRPQNVPIGHSGFLTFARKIR